MSKIHVAAPEAEVFLALAARRLKAHKEAFGSFPKAWSDLDITYANGPYNLKDEGVRPLPQDRTAWRPKKSHYTYRLRTSPNGQAFLLEAVNESGVVEYTMGSDDSAPVRVR